MPNSHQPHNHRRFLLAALIAAAVWVLVGCRTSPEVPVEDSPSPPTGAAVPTEKVSPTATSLPLNTPTSTPSYMPSPSATKTPRIIPQCIINNDPLYLNRLSLDNEAIVYQKFDPRRVEILTGNPPEARIIEVSETIFEDTPPAGNLATIVDPYTNQLILSDGKTTRMEYDLGLREASSLLPEESYLSGLGEFKWVNDRSVIATVYYREGIEAKTTVSFFLLYDLGTANWRLDILEALPNLYWGVKFFPTHDMSRIAYPQENKNEIRMVLWDLVNNEILLDKMDVTVPNLYKGISDMGAWSNDDQYLVLVDSDTGAYEPPLMGKYGLYIFDRDGRKKHKVPYDPGTFEYYLSLQPTWSGDGRYLAFVVLEMRGMDYEYVLYVYSMMTDEIILRCPDLDNSSTPLIYWAPNSQKVLLSDQVASKVMVIDIPSGEAGVILDKAIVGGWTAWSSK